MCPIPRARRALVLLAALAALVAVSTACQGLAAVRPDNRPSPVTGAVNGAMPDHLLAEVSGGCRIFGPAAPSLRALLDAAARAGLALVAAECYRDRAGQEAQRRSWCGRGRCQGAAVPGTSVHGWGKAADLAVPGGLTFDSPAFAWLQVHAGAFGWNHPGWASRTGPTPEPWHWEWVGDGGTLLPGSSHPA